MKTSFQLSIDTEMKQRLLNFTNQTGIPVARLVRDMLKKYLPEEERKHNIQLPLDRETHLYKGKKDKNRQK